jgi:hypothetical protein
MNSKDFRDGRQVPQGLPAEDREDSNSNAGSLSEYIGPIITESVALCIKNADPNRFNYLRCQFLPVV